jgi:glycosyltransferase involved in cell wall biosynthesis
MSKINVLEFSNQWSMGGTEKTAQLFLKHLNKDKFNVFAAGWRGGPRVDLVKPLVQDMLISENMLEMMQWIKSKNIDIVHFHRMGDPDHALIDVFAGVPILVEHNIFAHFDNTVDRLRIKKHIFVSNAQLEIYKQRSGFLFEPSKCVSLYNPVETEVFDAYDFNRDYKAPVFGRYSRNDPSKWHPINVNILPIIKREMPEAKFHVIGLPDPYRQAIEQLGCMDMVREFPNTVNENELCDFLNGITVMTHGSIYGESFGISIAESMAAKLPVVTHSGGDSAQAELVTDNHNGFVLHPSDVQGYANKVLHLLRNPDLKQEMGNRGAARVKEWFNVHDIVQKLEDVFITLHKEQK